MHGEWEMVRMVYKGVVQDPARVRGSTIKIEKGKLLLRYKDWNSPLEFRVEVRPEKEPKEIDLFLPNGALTRGIYELKGGTLRIVLGQRDDPRPTSFDAEKDKSLLLYTLDRFTR